MNKQEYKHIRNLAWDILIDARISQLPVDINAIASLYNLQNLINDSKSLYENALSVSEGILKIFGLNFPNFPKYLAIRILSPIIVLKEIGIKSAEEVSKISGLPIDLAKQRYNRYKKLIARNIFGISRLERIVLSQFRSWLNTL